MSEILGALFAVVVGLMYLPKIQNGIATQRQVMADVTTGQQQQQWVNAVTAYVQQNNATYLTSATTTPAPISVAAVKAANVGLPTGFSGTNPFNQTWAAAITQPTAGNLQVLVYTTGGTQINDQELGSIARAANGVGGMIPTNNSGVYPGGAATAYGAFGAWKIATASYGVTGGTPASLLNFSNGALTSNYLYRNAVPGQPQLNTMNTNFSMGGNTITNAQQIQLAAGNGVQVGNSYYYGDTVNSAIRQSGGLFIQNLAGSGPAPISSVSDINSVGTVTAAAAQINGSANINSNLGVGGAATVNSTLSVGQGSFMYGGATVYNGMNVVTGGVNVSNANINVAGGSITMSNGGQINNSGTQYIEAAGNLYLKPWNGNGITVVGGGGGSGQLEVTGHLQADQAIDSNNYIKAGNIASAGAGCGPSGAMGSDGAQALFCQSGKWTAIGSMQPKSVGSTSSDSVIGPFNWCFLQGFSNPQSDGTGLWQISLQSDGGPNNRYFATHNSKGGGGVIEFACF